MSTPVAADPISVAGFVMPDAEKVAVAYLLRVTEVIEQVSNRVSTEVPDIPVWPLVVLHRYGGTVLEDGYLSAPRIQYDCYGGTKSEARRLGATVQAAFRFITELPHENATVTGYAPGMDLAWQPQGPKNQPCYIGDCTLFLAPG